MERLFLVAILVETVEIWSRCYRISQVAGSLSVSGLGCLSTDRHAGSAYRQRATSCVVLVSIVEKVNYMPSIDDTPLWPSVSCYWQAYLISSDTAPR